MVQLVADGLAVRLRRFEWMGQDRLRPERQELHDAVHERWLHGRHLRGFVQRRMQRREHLRTQRGKLGEPQLHGRRDLLLYSRFLEQRQLQRLDLPRRLQRELLAQLYEFDVRHQVPLRQRAAARHCD